MSSNKTNNLTEEENALWLKIASFNLDDDGAAFKFSQRLARENGWTLSFAKKAIEEYKKFIFLCCITKTGVTPSDQVDQVWHLHLTYTKSYWKDLCEQTISKEIHHNPTKGGQLENAKFNDFYTETLQLYQEKFNSEAPKEIWPDNETRFSDIQFQRVNLKNYWLFRRPRFKSKRFVLGSILAISFFSIQATSAENKNVAMVIIAVFLFLFLYDFFKKSGRGGRGGGSCSSGCGGDSGCSGCSGSGCGGGCGGGD